MAGVGIVLALAAAYDGAREDMPFGTVPLVPNLDNVLDLPPTGWTEANGVVTLARPRAVNNTTVKYIVTGQYDPTLLRPAQFFVSPVVFNLTVNNRTYEGEAVGGSARRGGAAPLVSAATVDGLQTHAWRSAPHFATVGGTATMSNTAIAVTAAGARRWGFNRCVVPKHSTRLMDYAVCRGTVDEERRHARAWLAARVGVVPLSAPRSYTAVEEAALYAIAWGPAVIAVAVAAAAVG